ncbi:phage tail tape measure C-terminal domain-containing protein [Acinetobacter parvus]|uniref:Lambda family phage tail tape measure protein n=1 Tax=Acinetobacter parvus NIPH 1103 TaxID=1217671 RepID=N8Q1T1_9GAMM|nr:phage tail tape measure C-terminal domain-containing protein [Acinetobacter parvus]ENU32450.1 lambda family phage tail tape measure protein [Acinetobacter parvus NIPH 1103]
MSGRNLRLALEITANLNQARQAITGLRDDIDQTSDAADEATNAQNQLGRSAQRASSEIESSRSSLADLNDELSQTSASAEEAAQSNQVLENSVKNLAPHLLSLAGISGGFVAIAVDTLNKAVELDRLAEFSTTGVEQFQYYAAGAKKVGVETEQLAQIFKDAREKVGEFIDNGGGELADFFDTIAPKVGVTAEQFKKLTGPEILQLYVSSLQQAGVSQNEMIAYMERIADDATVLLPLLNNNGEGFKKYGEEAKAAGAILGVEVVEQAKTAKEALGQFQNRVSGITNQLVANAAPAIVFLAQNLDVLTKAGLVVASVYLGKVVVSLSTSVIAFIAARIEATRYQMTLASMAGVATTTAARLTAVGVASNLLTAVGGLPGLAIAAVSVATSFWLMRDSSVSASDSFDIQKASVDELIEKYKELNAETKQTYLVKLTEELEDQEKALKSTSAAMDEFILQKMKSIVGISADSKKAIQQYFNEIKSGGESAKTAFDRLKNTELLNDRELAKIAELGQEFMTTTAESDKTRQKINILNGSNQSLSTTANSATSATDALKDKLGGTSAAAAKAAGEINNLSKEFRDYLKTAQSANFNSQMELSYLQSGKSEAQAKAYTEMYNLKNSDPTAKQTYFVTDKELAVADARIKSEQKITDFKEQQKKQEEAITKQKEKQAKFSDLKIKSSEATSGGKTHQGTIELAKFVQDNFNIRHFSAFNDQYHQGKGGKHPQGLAFDFSLRDPKESQSVTTSLRKTLAEIGVNAGILNEYKSPSKNATGGHIHVSFASAADAQKFMAMTKTENKMKYIGEDIQDFRKQAQQQADDQKQKQEERLAFVKQFQTEREKLEAEHQENLKKANELGYTPSQKADLLSRIEQEYQDKLSKRPEILKRVQDQLSEIDQTWLRISGNGIEADMVDIANKWKQTQADIAALLMSETDPEKAAIYQKLLLKIDFVIDQEQTTLQFNKAVDEAQKIQDLKNTRLNNLKVQYDSGQISRSQYSEQAKGVQQELQPDFDATTIAAGDAAGKMQGIAGKQASADVERLKSGWAEVNNEASKYLPTLDQIEDKMVNGMTDAIMAWVDGTKSASDAFRQFASDFLREIAQMILKQMIFNAVKAASSAFGFAEGGFTGYATGGYTGAGGKYQPAGVVHKGEVVWSQEDIKAWGGVGVVESMRKHRGYAEGGIVAAPTLQVPTMQAPIIQAPQLVDNTAQIAQSTSFNASQNFYLVDDPARILETLNSSKGQENIVVMMSRDPSKFKAALKIGGG